MIGAAIAWLVPEAPRVRALVMRALVGVFATVYLVVRAPYLAAAHPTNEFVPTGICSAITAPLPPFVSWSLVVLAIVLGVAFITGRGSRLIGPLFALVLLWVLTYASSWGKLLHSENLLLLQVVVFAIAGPIDDERVAGWALRAASLVTVLTYFVAGMTKLRTTGSAWISGESLGNWLAWDMLRKIELGSFHSPLAAAIAASPVLLRVLATFTLVVELGAPTALVSRRVAPLWVVLAWLFHAGVLVTMAIGFFYPLSGIAFVSLLPIERLSIVRRITRASVTRTSGRRGAA